MAAYVTFREGLDVVIRLYEAADLPRLRTCLFTLVGQRRGAGEGALGEHLRVCIMTQRFSADQTRATREILGPLVASDNAINFVFHNWDYRDPFDVRVPLLNRAMEIADSRYMTIVECNDLVMPGALARLRRTLAEGDAAAAVGGVCLQPVMCWSDVALPVEQGSTSVVAATSPLVLLDRSRLLPGISFEVSLPDREIPQYLDRLRPRHRFDEHLREMPLCIRQIAA